jgi:hypothetical protein
MRWSQHSCFLLLRKHIYQKDVLALAQAKEGLAGVRRKGQQPLKMASVALQICKVLQDGKCCTPR